MAPGSPECSGLASWDPVPSPAVLDYPCDWVPHSRASDFSLKLGLQLKNAEDIIRSLLDPKSFWRQEEEREAEPENTSGPEPGQSSSDCPGERPRMMKDLQEKVINVMCSDHPVPYPVTQMPVQAARKTVGSL